MVRFRSVAVFIIGQLRVEVPPQTIVRISVVTDDDQGEPLKVNALVFYPCVNAPSCRWSMRNQ